MTLHPCAIANRAQAIERRGIEAGGITIGTASRGGLFELQVELCGKFLRHSPQALIFFGALHWRATDSALELQ